ncbi:MAG: DUF4255 domain-containing protein [Bacteroidota bacterium]
MIEEILTDIKSKLTQYLDDKSLVDPKISNADTNVIMDNIAAFDLSNIAAPFTNSIVMSLVNVEEESTLKNTPFKRRNPVSNTVDYIDPPVHINLYLLFSVAPDNTGSYYEKSLIKLSYIIQFFQHRKRFNKSVDIDGEEHNIQLIFELYTLTFEQINHLWGSLGGKQIPFVMYKARLIEIQEQDSQPAALIEEIENRVGHKNN